MLIGLRRAPQGSTGTLRSGTPPLHPSRGDVNRADHCGVSCTGGRLERLKNSTVGLQSYSSDGTSYSHNYCLKKL